MKKKNLVWIITSVVLLIAVIVLLILLLTGGSNGYKDKKNRTVNDLMDAYVRTIVKTDVDAGNSIFPKYYYDQRGEFTKEKLDSNLERSKKEYGDDFNITYEITKTTKMTDEELKTQNNNIKDMFNTKEEASECYKYEGTITFKGSKDQDTDPISTMVYCKYGEEWYLSTNYSS